MSASGNKRSGRRLPPAGIAEIPGIVAPLADLTPAVEEAAPAIDLPTPIQASIPPALAATVKPTLKPVVRAKPAPKPKPVAESAPAAIDPAPVVPEPVAAVADQVVETTQPVIEATEQAVTAATDQVDQVAEQTVAQVETVTDTITTAVQEAVVQTEAAAAPTTQQEKTIMDTVQNVTEKSQAAFAEANERAKGAVEKGARFFQEITEFGKGNVEAVVESSKIAAKGFESMGQDAAAYMKSSFEEASQALRTLATIKSPTELLKFQADYVRSSFDALVAQTSRGTEASLKLAGEVAQPISNRVAVAAEKIKVAA
ncbi:TIGR01841 family phasin [Sphingomonas sp. KR1UV-12]|uniref:TIGR01841 family phasin n=1 Tax=Sphingomonas aurea TaxID=3063994 RepID=A0ABT9ELX9_9SPHN|nr:TIGR01841 family phasin [Sphingomonas sp. KR1UV-12]MDP1027972.1 TIGR01841 family phasin [Sphingomonas sp. KR1UV-12]